MELEAILPWVGIGSAAAGRSPPKCEWYACAATICLSSLWMLFSMCSMCWFACLLACWLVSLLVGYCGGGWRCEVK